MGFEIFHSFNSDERNTRLEYYSKCSIAYFRFYWDTLEPEEGKYNFDLIDSLLDKGRQNGQDLALRFMERLSSMPTIPYGAVYFRKSNPTQEDWERDYQQTASDDMNASRH